jgi:hypothetical protein
MPFQFKWRGSWMGRGGQHNGRLGEGASATASPGRGGRAAARGRDERRVQLGEEEGAAVGNGRDGRAVGQGRGGLAS